MPTLCNVYIQVDGFELRSASNCFLVTAMAAFKVERQVWRDGNGMGLLSPTNNVTALSVA
jgi:hypothetical protein